MSSSPLQHRPIPTVAPGKRLLVVGRTGTGKSVLASWFALRSPGPWVIINPKHTKAYDSIPAIVVKDLDMRKIDSILRKGKNVDFRPSISGSSPEALDFAVLELHGAFKNFGIIIDELYAMHRGAQAGPGLIALLTRGRELRQSCIALTQRPAWVSRFAMSEADAMACLDLSLFDDRKRMREISGRDEMLERFSTDHAWKYYDVATDTIEYFSAVPPPPEIRKA